MFAAIRRLVTRNAAPSRAAQLAWAQAGRETWSPSYEDDMDDLYLPRSADSYFAEAKALREAAAFLNAYADRL